jgi:glycosyltransferase involved in cell wall biosynthesis
MLGLGLSRFVPAAARPALARSAARLHPHLTSFRARPDMRRLKARPRRAFRGDKVAVVGFFKSRIGLGRSADLLARELEAQGSSVQRIDLTAAIGLPENIDRSDCCGLEILADDSITDLVVHMNPPELYRAMRMLDPAWLDSRAVVGCFMWELHRAPSWWAPAIDSLDEVWVSSRFVKEALVDVVPDAASRVCIVRYGVDRSAWRPASTEERAAARRLLDLPTTEFVIMTSFAMSSSLARKNPIGAMESFRAAFVAGEPARLIVRCVDHHVYADGVAALRDAAATDPRIRLVLEETKNTAVMPYYQAADALITLHRGEGFGLYVAEALAMNIPVVATAWSLNDDFLAHPMLYAVGASQIPIVDPQHMYDIVPGTTWAEPSVDDAAKALRSLYEDRARSRAAV